MIVDCHTHYLPTPLLEALRAAKAGTPMGPFLAHPLDRLDQQLPTLDAEEIERALLTYSMLLEPAIAAAGMTRADGVRLANDEMAAAIRQFPDRFLGAAAVDSAAGEAALPELDRAVGELGMRAVHMVTNYDGLFLDSPTFWPIYRRAEELGVPVMVPPDGAEGLDGAAGEHGGRLDRRRAWVTARYDALHRADDHAGRVRRVPPAPHLLLPSRRLHANAGRPASTRTTRCIAPCSAPRARGPRRHTPGQRLLRPLLRGHPFDGHAGYRVCAEDRGARSASSSARTFPTTRPGGHPLRQRAARRARRAAGRQRAHRARERHGCSWASDPGDNGTVMLALRRDENRRPLRTSQPPRRSRSAGLRLAVWRRWARRSSAACGQPRPRAARAVAGGLRAAAAGLRRLAASRPRPRRHGAAQVLARARSRER